MKTNEKICPHCGTDSFLDIDRPNLCLRCGLETKKPFIQPKAKDIELKYTKNSTDPEYARKLKERSEEYLKITEIKGLESQRLERNQEYKADAGKPMLSKIPTSWVRELGKHLMNTKGKQVLVPLSPLIAVFRVMEQGAEVYDENTWQRVETFKYMDALYRHYLDFLDEPQGLDKDSGLPHLAHVITNGFFLYEQIFGNREKK